MTQTTPRQVEADIGFPANSGHSDHVESIEASVIQQGLVRVWLELNGIPKTSVRSATVKSIALAYTNRRYLVGWRRRVNPSYDLLGDTSEEEAAFDASDNGTSNTATTNTQTTQSSAQTEAWLKSLFAQIEVTVSKLTQDKLNAATIKLDEGAKAAIRDLAKQTANAVIEERMPPRTIEIKNLDRGTTQNLGQQHERFPKLLRALQATDHRGFGLNVWLTGPTGSGKTSAAEAAAKALGVTFGSDGSLDADYKVLGFRDANGNIVSTQFLEIYKNGGVYVADEIDNWLPSALLSLNAALANGWVSSPSGLIPRHKDCRVIACANTWGLGATSDYVGRTRLDAASLDRFQPKIDWPYDEKLELAIADNMAGTLGYAWFRLVQAARRKAVTQGLKIIISPRATFNGISLLQAGFDHTEVVDMTVCAGISDAQKTAIGPFVFSVPEDAVRSSAA